MFRSGPQYLSALILDIWRIGRLVQDSTLLSLNTEDKLAAAAALTAAAAAAAAVTAAAAATARIRTRVKGGKTRWNAASRTDG